MVLNDTDTWLIDTSALFRLGQQPETAVIWGDRISRGLVRISTVTLLEVGYSARSPGDLETTLHGPPIALMPVEFLAPAVETRAVEVQRQLARSGQHRAPSVPDLIVAAIAEAERLIVLHDDKDFELIASITGQRTERIAAA